ncbi:MAG: hypothetical protein AB7U61_07130 [Methylocystis sp.]
MPIRSDGKLDREKCLEWIRRNVDATTSSRGLFAAERTTRGDDDDNPVVMAMNAAVGIMFATIPGIAAAAARQAGASDEQVERIWSIAHELAMRQGNLISSEVLRIEPRGDYWPDIELCRKFKVEA